MGDWSTRITSSMRSSPSSSRQYRDGTACRFCPCPFACSLPVRGLFFGSRQGLIKHIVQQRRFARPGDSGDRDQHSQGTHKSIFLRLWARAPRILICRDAWLTPRRWKLNAKLSRKVAAGKRGWSFQDLVVSPGGDYLAAAFSGARSEIENTIGSPHHVGIVLNHQDCVSQVAQVVQDLDQAVSIAAVQADGRLIQHVQGSDQTRSQRSRQLNALCFASRESRGQAVEGQIFQPHVNQELQALLDFLQQLVGDSRFLLGQLDPGKKLARPLRRSCR